MAHKKTADIKGSEKTGEYTAACKIIFSDKIYKKGDVIDPEHTKYAVAHNLVAKKKGRG